MTSNTQTVPATFSQGSINRALVALSAGKEGRKEALIAFLTDALTSASRHWLLNNSDSLNITLKFIEQLEKTPVGNRIRVMIFGNKTTLGVLAGFKGFEKYGHFSEVRFITNAEFMGTNSSRFKPNMTLERELSILHFEKHIKEVLNAPTPQKADAIEKNPLLRSLESALKMTNQNVIGTNLADLSSMLQYAEKIVCVVRNEIHIIEVEVKRLESESLDKAIAERMSEKMKEAIEKQNYEFDKKMKLAEASFEAEVEKRLLARLSEQESIPAEGLQKKVKKA